MKNFQAIYRATRRYETCLASQNSYLLEAENKLKELCQDIDVWKKFRGLPKITKKDTLVFEIIYGAMNEYGNFMGYYRYQIEVLPTLDEDLIRVIVSCKESARTKKLASLNKDDILYLSEQFYQFLTDEVS